MTTLLERATTFERELIELRRDLHRHPELSFRETRTSGEVARRLQALGLTVRTGIARTGVVAELHNGAGPLVALRADMDALPIDEDNDVPYRSTIEGIMHACGHDAHVAMLTGAARLLSEAGARGDLPPGTVRFLFQPSEEASDRENKSGARRMIEEGALDGAGAVFGLHIGALPADAANLRPDQERQGAQERGLAAAIAAPERQKLASSQIEREAVEHLAAAAAASQVRDVEERARHRAPS